MESPSISRYVPQNSKKRVFPGESSLDPDVIEISPPVNRSSKSKALKIKEVMNHGIIDVDMAENRGNIMVTEGEADKSCKGKGAIRTNSFVTNSTSNHGSVDEDQSTKKSSAPGSQNIVNLDDFENDLSYLDDDDVDMYHDCMHAFDDSQMYVDEYAILQSHFDNIDIPPGVEAPVSWFPGAAQNKNTVATTNSSNQSILKLQPSLGGFLPEMEASQPLRSVKPWGRKSASSSSTTGTPVHAVSDSHKGGTSSLLSFAQNAQSEKGIAASKYFHYKTKSSGWGFSNQATFSGGASSHGPHNPSGSIEQHYGVEPAYGNAYLQNNTKKTVGVNSFLPGPYMHYYASEAYPVKAKWFNLDNSLIPMASPAYPMHFDPFSTEHMVSEKVAHGPFVQKSSTIQNNATDLGIPSGLSSRSQQNATDLGFLSGSSARGQQNATPKHVNEDEILKKFQQFKKFDIAQDPSDHYYVHNGSSVKQPSKSWSKKIQEEWKILEKDLPDTIFVRAYESRMDLLRAVIVGAEGTPYHDGLFFFDVFFPYNYPNVPPHVYYHSHGLRLNPNLYNNGKVCLSLLNTWSGSQKEMWIPKLSTMLQVLVSIQGLILNAKPYFNEPGFAYANGTLHGEKSSLHYNESTFMLSLRNMVFTLRAQPKHYEDFVVGHFFKCARDILVSCKAYMDGAQVGCLVRGGVQDVDEGDKSCSQYFKEALRGYIKPLVDAFSQIGVKDCEQFIPPAQAGSKRTEIRQIGKRLMSPALKTVIYFP